MNEFAAGIEKELYVLFDRKTNQYLGLSLQTSYATYQRQLYADLVDSNPRNQLAVYCADFDIYCLGTLNIKTGVITPKCEFIDNCADLRNRILQEQTNE